MSEQRESGIAVAEKLVRNVRHYCVILGAVRKSEEWWEGSKEVTSESTWRNLSWLKGMMNVRVIEDWIWSVSKVRVGKKKMIRETRRKQALIVLGQKFLVKWELVGSLESGFAIQSLCRTSVQQSLFSA